MIEMGSEYGWRLGELKGLRVEQLDFAARRIRSEVGTTKNGRGRTAVMTANVRALLAACVEGKTSKDFAFTVTVTPSEIFGSSGENSARRRVFLNFCSMTSDGSAVRNLGNL